jgi:hypothetical protein
LEVAFNSHSRRPFFCVARGKEGGLNARSDILPATTTVSWAERNLTKQQFLALEGISETTLKKMTREGYGPEWTEYPGTNVKRLTPEARTAWRAKFADWQKARAAKLEADRRKGKR